MWLRPSRYGRRLAGGTVAEPDRNIDEPVTEPDDAPKFCDIAELDDDAHQLRVTFGKMINLFRTFIRQYIAVGKKFADGRYGPDWTFNKWLIKKARLNPFGGGRSGMLGGILDEVYEAIDEKRINDAQVKNSIGIEAVCETFWSTLTSDQREDLDELSGEKARREKAEREKAEAPARKREQARERRANAKAAAAREAARAAERAARMAARKAAMERVAAGPDNTELRRLLAELASLEKRSRIELGRIYLAMQEIVDTQQAGKDEFDRPWTWVNWAAQYIKRSRSSIKQCIADYTKSLLDGQSLAISQDETVVPFPHELQRKPQRERLKRPA